MDTPLWHTVHEALGGHALLGRLFFSTLEFSLLALLLGLACLLLRPRRHRLVAVLWLVLMANAVAGLMLGTPLQVKLLAAPAPVTVEQARPAPDAAPLPTPRQAVPAHIPAPAALDAVAAAPAATPRPAIPAPAQAAPAAVLEPVPPKQPTNWAGWLVALWWAGVVLCALAAAVDRLRTARLLRASSPVPEAVQRLYREEAERLRVRWLPRLIATTQLESPAIVGAFRPTVLLPFWLVDAASRRSSEDPSGRMPLPQLRWSLRHELMHWKLGDPFGNLLRELTQILFFFNPLVWWAGRKWEAAMERACDRAVVASEDELTDYAEQLYGILVQARDRRQRLISGGLFATRSQIAQRMVVLLRSPLRIPAHLGKPLAAAVLLGAGLLFSFGLGIQEPTTHAQQQSPRAVHFPEDHSLGTLYTRPAGSGQTGLWGSRFHNEGWEPYVPAQGTVQVPAGQEMRLQVAPDAVTDLYPLAYLGPNDLASIDFRRTGVQDHQLQYLQGMQPRELLFEHTEITNHGLQYLGELNSLEYLDVGRTQVTGEGVQHLQDLNNLRGLDLNLSGVTDEQLRIIANMPGLEHLHLWQANITDESMAAIGGLTNLRQLGLEETEITDEGARHLAQLVDLQNINLGATAITDETLEVLRDLQKLFLVNLADTQVTAEGLRLLDVLEALEYLNVPNHIQEELLAFLHGVRISNAGTGPLTTVRFSDAQTLEPVAEAKVELRRRTETGGNFNPLLFSWTNDAGVTMFRPHPGAPASVMVGMPSPVAGLTVHAEGYIPSTFEWNFVEEPDAEFTLDPAIVIGGLVVDGDGYPVAGAKVQLPIPGKRDYARDVIPEHTESSDENGFWQCAHAPATLDTLSLTVTHPEFARTAFEPQDLSAQALRNETQHLVLDDGIEVPGQVVTEAGEPVPYAVLTKLAEGRGGRTTLTSVSTTSDEEGQFLFEHREAGAMKIRTEAVGFLADVREIQVDEGMAPVEVVLHEGSVLHGRVIGRDKRPIPGVATRYLDRSGVDYFGRSGAGTAWRGTTDDQGRFVWNGAPAEAVQLAFSKHPYQPRSVTLEPGDREHEIVLAMPLTIQGKVTDEATEAPVESFMVSFALAQEAKDKALDWRHAGMESSPQVSVDALGQLFIVQASDTSDATTGAYTIVIPEVSPFYAVRIEADGYEPLDSVVFEARADELEMDFALVRMEAGPRAMAAMREIEKKLARVESYKYVLRVVEPGSTAEENATQEEGVFRRPQQALSVTTRLGGGDSRFEVAHTTVSVNDREWWAHYHQPNRQSSLRKYDVQALRRHDIHPRQFVEAFAYAHPFAQVNVDTLRLESENDTQWVFTAEPLRRFREQFEAIRLKIRKEDGILLEKVVVQGDTQIALELVDIELNPELSDEEFAFTPPEDLEVDDQTQHMIAGFGQSD